MEPEIPKKSLRDSGALMRLDMVIAANLLEPFANMKRNPRLSVQRASFLVHINRMEHSYQIDGASSHGPRNHSRHLCLLHCQVRKRTTLDTSRVLHNNY
eukprot:4990088-Pyramimonas_sp.AAC.1